MQFAKISAIIVRYEKYNLYNVIPDTDFRNIKRGNMPKGKQILAKSAEKRVFGTAKVGEKGQIVIPKEAREAFGISSGDTMLIFGDVSCGLVITKLDVLNKTADEIIEKIKNNQ